MAPYNLILIGYIAGILTAIIMAEISLWRTHKSLKETRKALLLELEAKLGRSEAEKFVNDCEKAMNANFEEDRKD